jgi:hypothetical protein
MRLQFQKRRYYKGSFRNIGDVVEVSNKFARAFLRVGAAIPAPGKAESAVPIKEPDFTRKRILKESEILRQSELIPDLEGSESTEDLAERDFEAEPLSDEKEKAFNWESLSYQELQAMCRDRGLPSIGKKALLIQTLKESQDE